MRGQPVAVHQKQWNPSKVPELQRMAQYWPGRIKQGFQQLWGYAIPRACFLTPTLLDRPVAYFIFTQMSTGHKVVWVARPACP